jgi:hypothetical protein
MHTSSSTLTVTLNVVAPECRTALLTASRTSFDVVGQCSIDHRQRAGELTRGAQIGAGELRDRLIAPLPQSGTFRGCAVQVEDRSSDLLEPDMGANLSSG